MDLELEGKAAIVTGGSRGIGKAVARELGLEGVDVAIVARGREALDETAAELAAETGGASCPSQPTRVTMPPSARWSGALPSPWGAWTFW